MELTGLDLSALMQELEQLEEGFIQKVYQREDELTLEIYVPGEDKERLILGPSYAFISNYKRENPERPPGFCMELRKHLGRVDSIEQRGFDRILEIESGEHTLVVEMFGKGNAVLLQGEKVIGALRQEEYAERAVVVGKKYQPPEPTEDPRDMEDYFQDLEGDLVRQLASGLSLGGTYAEEICERAEVEKEADIEDLDEEERDAVYRAIDEILCRARNPEPVLYLEDNAPERAAPFPLQTYSEYAEEEFDSFSRALDELFYRKQQEERQQKKQEAYQEKRQGLERQKEQQERKIEGLQKSSEENRRKAELIYENYQLLEEIKEQLEEGIEEHGWDETEERVNEADSELSERLRGFNEQEGFVTVEVEGMSVRVEPFEDLEATASAYYDKAKDSEQKMESAKKALEETEEKLAELEKESIEVEEAMEDKSSQRSKKWFEKYRWFRSSEGYLVCVGRDAQTNEMLVKKHMEENDLYFHADFEGGPSVVVKDGQDAGEKTREEAAKAAVTFSRNWKAGITSGTAYHVKPGQVTKEPESGEYLKKGAFVIRGERKYLRNISVEASIGPHELDGVEVPMCGPHDAVEENCFSSVKLEPGGEKKSGIAKNLQEKFREQGHELDLDYIIRALPPGKSRLG
ncbi:MAG: ribosome rescue protein RqcH [Candidatus Nanohaloarchaea archaeon]